MVWLPGGLLEHTEGSSRTGRISEKVPQQVPGCGILSRLFQTMWCSDTQTRVFPHPFHSASMKMYLISEKFNEVSMKQRFPTRPAKRHRLFFTAASRRRCPLDTKENQETSLPWILMILRMRMGECVLQTSPSWGKEPQPISGLSESRYNAREVVVYLLCLTWWKAGVVQTPTV